MSDVLVPQQPPRRRTGLIAGLVAAAVVVVAGGAAAIYVATSSNTKSGSGCLVGTWQSTSATDTAKNADGDTTATSVSGLETVIYRSNGTGSYTDSALIFASASGDGKYAVSAKATFHYKASGTVVTYTSVSGSQSIADPTTQPATTAPLTKLDPNTYSCNGNVLTESQSDPEASYSASYIRKG